MPYTHFGKQADVFKHVILCEVLKREKPDLYVETNSACAEYMLSNSLEQQYGICHFLNNVSEYNEFTDSNYLNLERKAYRDHLYLGSPGLAMNILNSPSDELLFFDIEKEPLKNIEAFAQRDGFRNRIRTFNQDSIRGTVELLPSLPVSSFIHIDPYEIDKSGNIVHYSPYNGEVKSGYMYTDTGFWDTFRALFPFLNLMYPSVNKEIQEGLANTYKESGFLPEWASPGHRHCMVGNNSASVVVDAYLKGCQAEEISLLYEAVLHGANNVHPQVPSTGRLGHEYYNRLGYVPYNVGINENVARTLEYAYDDWCIMKLAQKLNRPQEEIDLYRDRSKNYRFVFDKDSKLMRGKNEDGTFQSPFSPYKWGDAFTEGNSWHYTWSVFHDVQGLIDLMGGKESFVSMLDSVFVVPPVYDDSYYGQCIHEIKEMQIMNMGNYAHGNQPIQHMIYLYNYAGQPWKGQYWLREVMDKLYTPYPDGYCGDEDNGQTSAWYIFSALGFYPVCPGSGEYVMGAPLFKKAILTLENGKQVILNAPDNTNRNRYIHSLKMNGKEYNHNWLKHEELMNGAVLDFEMSHAPNTQRGVNDEDFPYSLTNENK